MLFQVANTTHCLRKSALACTIGTVVIMQMLGATIAYTNDKVILLEDLTPRIIQQGAIGLKVVADLAVAGAVFFLSATT